MRDRREDRNFSIHNLKCEYSIEPLLGAALAEMNGRRKFRYNLPRDRRIINSMQNNAAYRLCVSFKDVARKLKNTSAHGVTHLGINGIIAKVRWGIQSLSDYVDVRLASLECMRGE